MKTYTKSPTATFIVVMVTAAIHIIYVISTAAPTATGLAFSLGIVPLIWFTLRIFITWEAYCELRDARTYQLLGRRA